LLGFSDNLVHPAFLWVRWNSLQRSQPMQEIDFYRQILGVQYPWCVAQVKLVTQAQHVDVFVDHLRGGYFIALTAISNTLSNLTPRSATRDIWTPCNSVRSYMAIILKSTVPSVGSSNRFFFGPRRAVILQSSSSDLQSKFCRQSRPSKEAMETLMPARTRRGTFSKEPSGEVKPGRPIRQTQYQVAVI
jgi:hypothetical protein